MTPSGYNRVYVFVYTIGGLLVAVETAKSHTVRVSARTHRVLRELSESSGEPITQIVARAVERYRRERVLQEANAMYAAALADPEEMAAFRAEFDDLAATFHPGPQDEPW
jgi:hypothetical protein